MIAAVATFVALLIAAQPVAAAHAAGSECGAGINPIVCENEKLGTDPGDWDIWGAGDASIQGFATDISVNAGSKIDFKIDTDAAAYAIDIYRTGWYQGLGARFITSVPVSAALPQVQPECISDATTELYDCGTWGVSASWDVPQTAVSGVYIAKLTRADTEGASHITFIVRQDGNTSDVLFQTSDPTWQAYNSYGGSDFYLGAANGRAYKISYNRPFATREGVTARDFYFSSEYATVRFLERNGYDVSYIAGVDTDRRGGELLNHDVFLSVGHDEYWSGAQRANVEAARDAGVNLQFLSGNEVYWRTRYEPSVDPSATAYRTLVSYKETWSNAKIDPSSEWTGTWRDPRFAGAAQGGHSPENALTGTIYAANHNDLAVTVSSDEGKLRAWRGTGLSALAAGTSAELAPHTVGYESDEVFDNGHNPGGLIRLSTTVGPTPEYLTDYGNTVVAGTTTHHLTLYRAPSDALVFSAGTIQWGWGLDEVHDGNGAPADPRMQQAQVNLLADMGAQPATLMPGLVAASRSTDATAPVTVITSPAAGASVAHGSEVTVTGTASDTGGVVAGVEVSTDGGATWYAATGTTSWSYTYIQQGTGSATIIARAIDDSANHSAAGTTRDVQVGGPASVFGQARPALASSNDTQSIELGLRFIPSVDGFVSGVRFYKGASNTGQHTGSLWSPQGARLASVVFGQESAEGWQSALFAEPIAVLAGQQYTVSYTAPQGGYSYEEYYWPYKARATQPLDVPRGSGTAAAGVYGWPGAAPTQTFREGNYFVDVLFEGAADSPVRLTAQSPAPGAGSVALDSAVSARFTRPVVPSSVGLALQSAAGDAVDGTLSYDQARRELRFAPSTPLAASTTYTVTVSASSSEGVAFAAGDAWTFTTAGAGVPGSCPCTIYDESDVPSIASTADSARVTVGTIFSVTEPGYVSGVRFYKGAANVGVHKGTLWDAATRHVLASVTFTGESASGWQTAEFDAPVAVTPGTEYRIGYLAPSGGYAVTPGAFATPLTRGPIQVPASGGAFVYADGFPDSTSTSSYFVEPIFVRAVTGASLTATTPAAGATDVDTATSITLTYSAPLTAAPTVTVSVGETQVAGATTLSADGRIVTFDPTGDLPTFADVVVRAGATSSAGGVGIARSWSFRTAAAPGAVHVSFFGEAAPAPVSYVADGASVELGMAFRSAVAGRITGIRFFKAPGDTGTHTATLWGPTGAALTDVTFTAESDEGWQRAQLAVPIEIAAGETYTVSYRSPQGRYAFASSFFAAPVSAGPLTALSPDNGVYRYGTGGVMPTASWNSTNYFVDVDFVSGTDTAPVVTVASRAPEGAGAPTDAAVTAVLSADAASPTLVLTAAGAPVAGASSYDAATRTVGFAPAAPLAHATTYTAAVKIAGQTLDSWSFTTVEPVVDGVVGTLFGDASPQVDAVTDAAAVEVGTAFRVSQPGWATAIRFYKGTGNGGTHVGHLWKSNGDAMAEVVFADETATGWQRAALSTPVRLEPGEEYVVSYLAPGGRYAVTSGYFSEPVVNDFITGVSTQNGRFVYGAAGGFPTGTWGASAYFVDAEVTFGTIAPAPAPAPAPTPSPTPTPTPTPEPSPTPAPAAAPVTVTASSPAAGATDVAPTTTVTAVLDTDAPAATLALQQGATAVAGASAYDAATRTLSFTPTDPLAWSTAFTATVTVTGTSVNAGEWTFATGAAPPVLEAQTIFGAATPQHPAWDDPAGVQVATRFTVSVAGQATSVRFYKGDANTGLHTGYLWRADGVKLAEIAFIGETASGWQEAVFTQPVDLEAGIEYRVGLHSTTGRYAVDLNGLAAPSASGVFSTPASGAAYTYSQGFPDATSTHNYWVDVTFAPRE